MAPSPALPPPPPPAVGPAMDAERPSESTGGDLFKRLIWIPAPAALGYVAASAVKGGLGAVSIYVVIAALLCVPAQVLAFLWASRAWGRLLDWRLASAGVLAAASVACLASVSQPVAEAIRPYRIGLQPNDVVFTPDAMWVSDGGDGTVYGWQTTGTAFARYGLRVPSRWSPTAPASGCHDPAPSRSCFQTAPSG